MIVVVVGLADDVVVDDLHTKRSFHFHSDGESDVSQPDDAQRVTSRIVRHRREIVVGILPFDGGARSCGQRGGCHMSEDGNDVEEGRVCNRLVRRMGAVAVYNS